MTKSTIHRIRNTRFIRLPEALEFPETVKQIDVFLTGQTLTITPSDCRWDDFFGAPGVSSDFLTNRTQDPRPT